MRRVPLEHLPFAGTKPMVSSVGEESNRAVSGGLALPNASPGEASRHPPEAARERTPGLRGVVIRGGW